MVVVSMRKKSVRPRLYKKRRNTAETHRELKQHKARKRPSAKGKPPSRRKANGIAPRQSLRYRGFDTVCLAPRAACRTNRCGWAPLYPCRATFGTHLRACPVAAEGHAMGVGTTSGAPAVRAVTRIGMDYALERDTP